MKRWKITTAKPTPVTCENCEEGRKIVCRVVHDPQGDELIRVRRGAVMTATGGSYSGDSVFYTFIRYLDPDPETPKQVRFADVGFGGVFVTDRKDVVFWKSVLVVWFSATGTGEVAIWDLDSWNNSDIVTLTGQVAELVEDE